MTTGLTVTHEGGVGTVLLDRTEKRNAIDLALAEELKRVALEWRARPPAAIVIRSSGPGFSVGGDLRSFGDAEDPEAHVGATATALHDAMLALRATGSPIVTAAAGVTAGAGVGLVLSGDIVIVEPATAFRAAYLAVGLTPDAGASWWLAQAGHALAADLLLTNRALDAETALAAGLVSRIVPAGTAGGTAAELASSLAEGPRQAIRTTLALLREATDTALPERLRREAAAIASSAASRDGIEGVRAFLAKRSPAWASSREALDPGRGGE